MVLVVYAFLVVGGSGEVEVVVTVVIVVDAIG
jgi:hypothetical protein